MTNRRAFLGGLLAAGLCPRPTWADAGNPAALAAARRPDGSFALYGLTTRGERLFEIPLPGRGHAAAAHPHKPQAVAFARRPGTFAIALDCRDGQTLARLTAPQGRHFYGHGAFSPDGTRLFTTENDYDTGAGRIGVWDVTDEYTRIGEFSSGGIGPHELRLMPDGRGLVIANGGIETHPDSGRAKLNLPFMEPNLSFMDLDGTLTQQYAPPSAWHKNSMRHLAISLDGTVAVACQWQGDMQAVPPLLALCSAQDGLRFVGGEAALPEEMQGYAGSVAISDDGQQIAITSPRGDLAVLFDQSGRVIERIARPDICGVACLSQGFMFTGGDGKIHSRSRTLADHPDLAWDNHLVAISTQMA